MTKKRLFFTFVGTWVSAATILGFTGNVYHSGLSVIASSVIPWFIGRGSPVSDDGPAIRE
mgnify:CR=1 FL=1